VYDVLRSLEHEDYVAVNLHSESEDETEFGLFDCSRALHVLTWITADFDEFARSPLAAATAPSGSSMGRWQSHRWPDYAWWM
jgi:hypothetical protein